MFGMWDVWDVGCSGCGMFVMRDAGNVGCLRCEILDVGCLLGCGMVVYQMPPFTAVKVSKVTTYITYISTIYLHFCL